MLPDGELEDLGTVLSVRVAAHVTREIQVQEGARCSPSPRRRGAAAWPRPKLVALRNAVQRALGVGAAEWHAAAASFGIRPTLRSPGRAPSPRWCLALWARSLASWRGRAKRAARRRLRKARQRAPPFARKTTPTSRSSRSSSRARPRRRARRHATIWRASRRDFAAQKSPTS